MKVEKDYVGAVVCVELPELPKVLNYRTYLKSHRDYCYGLGYVP